MVSIIVNGSLCAENELCLQALDRGFTLGHGIFETMLCIKGRLPLFDYHWQRLSVSAPLLGITLPFDWANLHAQCQSLLTANRATHKIMSIRLTISDGVGHRGLVTKGPTSPTYTLTTSDWTPSPPSISATFVSTRRNELSLASKIKNISYLDNILAKREAFDRGFDEAIILNSKNYLAEGAVSNVYMVSNHHIYTPPIADGALPGVIRHLLLNELNDGKIIEQSIAPECLLQADEIFISNALIGIKPIHQLDNQSFSIFSYATQFKELLRRRFDYL